MRRSSWFSGLLLALAILCGPAARGQEFRVYTRTADLSGTTPAKAPIVARSLTLFHAGKVYDYIDSLREVTVFEPVHRRFIILHESSNAVATVSQDEVRRYLSMAEDEVYDVAAEQAKQSTPTAKSALQLLRLQLHPTFETAYDETGRRLRMDHPALRYEVECTNPPEAPVAETYFRYADAVSELNSVLHPHSLLPKPRMALNEELRTRGLLPRTVRRQVTTRAVTDLRAEHEWEWQLTDLDRQMIADWDRTLRRNDLRHLDFRQFQQEVLSGRLTAR